MLEIIILSIFVLTLLFCAFCNISIIFGLLVGYVIFFIYGIIKKHSVTKLLALSIAGIQNVKMILIVFSLIGILTASWRASGTIATLISLLIQYIDPSYFVLFTFISNCMLSFLIGTAFGTAATTGALCMVIAHILGCNEILVGGAVISGCYFGDRCSPISSNTLLISQITETKIYDNIGYLFRNAIIPFCITCVVYIITGRLSSKNIVSLNVDSILKDYANEFQIHEITLIPVGIILISALFKINIKIAISISSISAILISIFLQQMPITELLNCLVYGYRASIESLQKMINGGGLLSMLKVCCIVLISSTYSGLFQVTKLMNPMKAYCQKISIKTNHFCAVLSAAIFSCIVSCNQPFGVILTNEIVKDIETDHKKRALYLANTSSILPALFFWNVAATTTLASCNAPSLSPIAACYLYLVPLCTLLCSFLPAKTERLV